MMVFVSLACAQNKGHIILKDGIVYLNGKAIYFRPGEVFNPEFKISKDYLFKQKKHYPIYPGGRLSWMSEEDEVVESDKNAGLLAYYSIDMTNNNRYIIDSQIVLKYVISNNAIYLKDDKSSWEKLEFKLLKVDPNKDIMFVMYLKSKWFEGEYNMYGMP